MCNCDAGPDVGGIGKMVTARKSHQCDECGQSIQPGERYEYTAGLWEGEWLHFAVCLGCLMARDAYYPSAECWCFGGIWDDIEGEGDFASLWYPGRAEKFHFEAA